jgi:hypothetical protein
MKGSLNHVSDRQEGKRGNFLTTPTDREARAAFPASEQKPAACFAFAAHARKFTYYLS